MANVPSVFISSTIEDLREYRNAAKEAALDCGFLSVLSDNFPVGDAGPQLETCLAKVSACGLLVVDQALKAAAQNHACPAEPV